VPVEEADEQRGNYDAYAAQGVGQNMQKYSLEDLLVRGARSAAAVRMSMRRLGSMRVPVIGSPVMGVTMIAVSIMGMPVRRVVVGMTVVMTVGGMLGGITVIRMVRRFVHLGRFQIRYGVVVVVMMVVVITAVRVTVMTTAVLEHEDPHQVYDESQNGYDEEPFVLDVRRFEYSLDGFREDEECDEKEEETVDEARDNFSAHVAVGKRLRRLPSCDNRSGETGE